jgi:hypothetical protein
MGPNEITMKPAAKPAATASAKPTAAPPPDRQDAARVDESGLVAGARAASGSGDSLTGAGKAKGPPPKKGKVRTKQGVKSHAIAKRRWPRAVDAVKLPPVEVVPGEPFWKLLERVAARPGTKMVFTPLPREPYPDKHRPANRGVAKDSKKRSP